jgi:hypothetical protein
MIHDLPYDIQWIIYNYTIHPLCYILKSSVSKYYNLNNIPIENLIQKTIMLRELEYIIKHSIRKNIEEICFFLEHHIGKRELYEYNIVIYKAINDEQNIDISPIHFIERNSISLYYNNDPYYIEIPKKSYLLNFKKETRNILFPSVFKQIMILDNSYPYKIDINVISFTKVLV